MQEIQDLVIEIHDEELANIFYDPKRATLIVFE